MRLASTLEGWVYIDTKPAPENKHASDDKIAAPPMPSEPARISALPKFPLCEFLDLFGIVILIESKLNSLAIIFNQPQRRLICQNEMSPYIFYFQKGRQQLVDQKLFC